MALPADMAGIMTDERIGQLAALESVVDAPRGRMRVSLDLDCRDKDGNLTSHFHKDDITVLQLAQSIQAGLGALTGQTLKATDATTQTVNAAITMGTPKIHFGIGATAAAFTDFTIQTTAGAATDAPAATINAISSNTFTITATWTNSTAGSISISELAWEAVLITGVTTTGKSYILTHDQFTGQPVSAGGTAAATLTFTFT